MRPKEFLSSIPYALGRPCIGCGICENKCPVMDDPAIYCTSVGEDRSEKNRLLLETIQPAVLSEEPKDPYR